MNTNSNTISGLKSRSEQLNTTKTGLVKINQAQRRVNRSLNTENLLALLRTETPDFFKLAEVVGQWVWIQFADKQPKEITSHLAELGFHWNNARQTWQHPCGTLADERATYDPRKRYGSYFAAQAKPA